MGFLEKIFGTHSEREIKRLTPLVNKIENLRSQMLDLSDDQLKEKTLEFKKRLSDGESLDDLFLNTNDFYIVKINLRKRH